MSKKELKFKGGLAYSTNSNLKLDTNELEGKENLTNDKQKLKVVKDNKKRAGKDVTLILKFIGTDEAMEDLCKLVKSKCGCGGSVKDGEIIIQGDIVDKVKQVLVKAGYGLAK
jgi:translation initiation factor 1